MTSVVSKRGEYLASISDTYGLHQLYGKKTQEAMGKDSFPELYRPMVDEAPHLRHRTVPMKVLVLGYPRTGTSCKSLVGIWPPLEAKPAPAIQKAPEQLGYGPCYHMRTAINEFPKDCKMWRDAYEAKYDGNGKPFGREEWDQLLGRYSVRPPISPPSHKHPICGSSTF